MCKDRIIECMNEIEIKGVTLKMSSGMISKMLKRKERGRKFFPICTLN